MQKIYNFLSELEKNNNKEWFDDHRAEYQSTKDQFLSITELLINEIRVFDPDVPLLDPKKCMFRIFRDVRFSNDKRPYKNNFGSFIARGGRKSGFAGYYFHMQPCQSFIGGGVFMPPAPTLKAIRKRIYNDPDEFLEIIGNNVFKNTFKLYDEQMLKIAPKGFPKDFEHIELLRYKSYAPFLAISDEQLFSPDLFQMIIDKFKVLYPFNQYINSTI